MDSEKDKSPQELAREAVKTLDELFDGIGTPFVELRIPEEDLAPSQHIRSLDISPSRNVTHLNIGRTSASPGPEETPTSLPDQLPAGVVRLDTNPTQGKLSNLQDALEDDLTITPNKVYALYYGLKAIADGPAGPLMPDTIGWMTDISTEIRTCRAKVGLIKGHDSEIVGLLMEKISELGHIFDTMALDLQRGGLIQTNALPRLGRSWQR